MTYKLLALDMDGTTLAPDTTMTAATKEAIGKALDAGVTVVFCILAYLGVMDRFSI